MSIVLGTLLPLYAQTRRLTHTQLVMHIPTPSLSGAAGPAPLSLPLRSVPTRARPHTRMVSPPPCATADPMRQGDAQSATEPRIPGASPLDPPTAGAAPLPSALGEIELLGDVGGRHMLERWEAAYRQMAEDAHKLGIPRSAIQCLPERPTKEELRAARDHLDGMIQSFLSAGL